MSIEVPTGQTVRRIQAAAIERALLDGDGRYVAFAGALEPLRREADSADATGLVGPLLACAALAAGEEPPPLSASAWVPSGGDGRRLAGAVVAVREFGVDVERAAALAGRPEAAVRSALRRDAE